MRKLGAMLVVVAGLVAAGTVAVRSAEPEDRARAFMEAAGGSGRVSSHAAQPSEPRGQAARKGAAPLLALPVPTLTIANLPRLLPALPRSAVPARRQEERPAAVDARGDFATLAMRSRTEGPDRPVTPQRPDADLPSLRQAYCVRACDGRFFPLSSRVSDPSDPDAYAQCTALCPKAQVTVFAATGSVGIEAAVDGAGRPYAALANAFLFRQRQVDGCSCSGSGTVGLAPVAIEKDPTLRRGDLVITDHGARVFTGDLTRAPFRPSDLVAPGPDERAPPLDRNAAAR